MKVRHEINIINNTITSVANQRFLLTPSQYSGTVTYYFEVLVIARETGAVVYLRRAGTTTADATINPGTTGLFRVQVTPPGTQEYTVYNDFCQVKSAKLIIIQNHDGDPLTNSETQIDMTTYTVGRTNTTSTPYPAPKYWKYDSTKWDGTQLFYFEIVYEGTNNMYVHTFELQQSDGTGDGFVGWSTISSFTDSNQVITRVRSAAFTPVNGRNYRIAAYISNNMGGYQTYNARIIVRQSGTITKLQEQYIIANTQLIASTANQNYLTYWDPAEWGGVTNEYLHTADASDNNTSVVDLRDASSNQISGSVITTPDNQESSSAVTMPASAQNIDVRATTDSGNVFMTRILVNVVQSAVVSLSRRVLLIT